MSRYYTDIRIQDAVESSINLSDWSKRRAIAPLDSIGNVATNTQNAFLPPDGPWGTSLFPDAAKSGVVPNMGDPDMYISPALVAVGLVAVYLLFKPQAQ